MSLRCLECASDLRDRVLVTRLADISVWFCDSCGIYYDKEEMKDLVLCP
ncbi:hypothetical protein [Nitrososphaera sp.]|nr:hypothetical protein [Nitrososphaera sp.]NWG37936.1 hypothetical protein [Nitrososphaera sp.]